MCQGEIARLTIPSEKGYGKRGFPAWGYPFMLYTDQLIIINKYCSTQIHVFKYDLLAVICLSS